MNRIRAGSLGDLNNLFDVEIAFGRSSRPDAISFVGHAHVQSSRVGLREHRNRRDVQIATRANDANSDLASISYQNFAKHSKSGDE